MYFCLVAGRRTYNGSGGERGGGGGGGVGVWLISGSLWHSFKCTHFKIYYTLLKHYI